MITLLSNKLLRIIGLLACVGLYAHSATAATLPSREEAIETLVAIRDGDEEALKSLKEGVYKVNNKEYKTSKQTQSLAKSIVENADMEKLKTEGLAGLEPQQLMEVARTLNLEGTLETEEDSPPLTGDEFTENWDKVKPLQEGMIKDTLEKSARMMVESTQEIMDITQQVNNEVMASFKSVNQEVMNATQQITQQVEDINSNLQDMVEAVSSQVAEQEKSFESLGASLAEGWKEATVALDSDSK